VVDDLASASTGGPFFPGVSYGPARRPYTYDIFLASSGEVADQRDDVEELVMRAFSPALGHYSEADLHIVRWEQALPDRLPDESIDEFFVRVVRKCKHTVVLLMTHLGQGTRAEVQAAIEKNLPVSIIRFDPPDGHESEYDPAEIDEFLKEFQEQGKPVVYKPCGPPGSPTAAEALSHVFASIMLGAYRSFLAESKDALVESRG
jgi:hypothetical protein